MAKNKTPLGLTYDNLVVGSSLEAFYFSFIHKYKFIYTLNERPFPIERNIFPLWKMLSFQLSLAGYNPFDERIVSIKYLGNDSIKVVTKENNSWNIKFNKLFIFSDHNLYDFPIQVDVIKKDCKVIDWFYTDSKINVDISTINRESKFISLIEPFYRNINSNVKRNFAVVSHIPEEQLASHDYDANIIRIKLPAILGQKDLEFVHEERSIINRSKNVYQDFDNVHYIYDSIEEIHNKMEFSRYMDYMEYLRIKLGIKWTQLGELPTLLE